MFAKKKGWRREDKTRKILEKAGYEVCRAGSSLGMFDLIAINKLGIRLLQVKSNYCRPFEIEQIKLFNNIPLNATKELWIWFDNVKEPVIKIL